MTIPEENSARSASPRLSAIQSISEFCGLAALFLTAFLTDCYGNLLLSQLQRQVQLRSDDVLLLFLALSQVLLHGLQNLLFIVSWQTAVRKVSHYAGSLQNAAEVVTPPSMFLATVYLLPFLSPNLALSISMHCTLEFLLLCLFQFLTLRVENILDRSLALLLWLLSFQSLEMIVGAPLPQFPMLDKNSVFLSLTGFTLFFCFLAGAVSSSWLLVKYSIRLSTLRNSWISAELRHGETSVSGVNILDVNNLVHDIKNALAVIKGTTKLLEKKEPSEKTELILKAVDYLETMSKELLSGDEKHAVTVDELCSMVNRHSNALPWSREVTMLVEPDVENERIMANKIRLMRAVLNILDNAWRGNETVGTHGILFHAQRAGEMAEIEIIDNGPGYRGAATTGTSGWGSTGLGLTFTRRVISLHGGSLMITDRADQQHGARVVIYLPIFQEQEPPTPDA